MPPKTSPGKGAGRGEQATAGDVSLLREDMKKNIADTNAKLQAQEKKLDAQAKILDDLKTMMQNFTQQGVAGAAGGGTPPGLPQNQTNQQVPRSAPQVSSRRAPDASSVEMLPHNITRAKLVRWRRVWEAYEERQQLSTYPES